MDSTHGEKRDILTEELRLLQIEILKAVDKFCKENDIQYFLFAGTLIGAARHRGYIPWDDDIDICMLRNDYDKFFELFNKNRDDSFKAINHDIMPEYYLASGKVVNSNTVLIEETTYKVPLGVYIDVFPMDKVPNDDKELSEFNKKIKPYRDLLQLKAISYRKDRVFWKNMILVVGRFLTKSITVDYLIKKITKLATYYQDKEGCNRLADISVFTYGLKEVFNKEDFENSIELEFEGGMYNVPVNYDQVLKCMYGDYMKLPPEEKRIAHHKFLAYWK